MFWNKCTVEKLLGYNYTFILCSWTVCKERIFLSLTQSRVQMNNSRFGSSSGNRPFGRAFSGSRMNSRFGLTGREELGDIIGQREFKNQRVQLSPPPKTSSGGFSKMTMATIFLAGIVGRTVLKALLGDAASPVVLLLIGGFLYYYRHQENLKQQQTADGLRSMQSNMGSVEGFTAAFGGKGSSSSFGGGASMGNDRNFFRSQSGTIKLSRAEVSKIRRSNNNSSSPSTVGEHVSFSKGKSERRVYQGRTRRRRRGKISSVPTSTE